MSARDLNIFLPIAGGAGRAYLLIAVAARADDG